MIRYRTWRAERAMRTVGLHWTTRLLLEVETLLERTINTLPLPVLLIFCAVAHTTS